MYLPVFISLVASALELSSAQYTVYHPGNQVIFGGNASSFNGALAAAALPMTPQCSNHPLPKIRPFLGFSVEMSVARHVRTYFLMLGIFFDI